MQEKEAAAKIYLLSKDKSKDQTLKFLRFLRISKDLDLEKIEDYYAKILNGSLKVLEVVSGKPLDDKYKSLICEKFSEKNLILLFSLDDVVSSGIIVRENDKVLDFSISGLL
ncbi:MAG: F0F1 ATP synthase subunit delta [Patescibacteria group bacterium]